MKRTSRAHARGRFAKKFQVSHSEIFSSGRMPGGILPIDLCCRMEVSWGEDDGKDRGSLH